MLRRKYSKKDIIMNNLAFDTLHFSDRMKAVGFTNEQAAEQARVFAEIINDKIVTKQDLLLIKQDILLIKKDIKNLESRLTKDIEQLRSEVTKNIEQLRSEVTKDIEQLRSEVKKDLKGLELRLTTRLGGMIFIAVITVATLVKLL